MEINLSYEYTESVRTSMNKKFRFWHLENLLNQSANLIDLCLKDLKEIKQIEALEFSIIQEIELRKEEIKIEKAKKNYERELIDNSKNIEILDVIIPPLQQAASSAHIIWNEHHGHPEVQNANEASARSLEAVKSKEKYLIKDTWLRNDFLIDESFINFKEKQILNKEDEIKESKSLDFSYQKQLSVERLIRNFNDCLDRLVVIEIGLEKIYGKSFNIFEEINLIEDISLKINHIYNFIYNQIASLVEYSQLDQSFTLSFSVMSLLSDQKVNEFKSSTSDFIYEFEIPKTNFPLASHDNIRFRGIGASLLGEAGQIPWKIELRLPEKGIFIREGVECIIDQQLVPSCILGRVENRNSIRNIEICGMVSLFNCSPISYQDNKWFIKIIKPNLTSETFDKVTDIIIEINLTGKLL